MLGGSVMKKQITKKIAKELGIPMQDMCCAGEYRGYEMAIMAYSNCVVTTIVVQSNVDTFDWEDFANELNENPFVEKCFYERHALRIRLKGNNIADYLDFLDGVLIERLQQIGHKSACCSCGQEEVPLKFYEINGKRDFLCEKCVKHICTDIKTKKIRIGNEKSNLFTGIVGAFAGIAIGLFLWILASNVGLNANFVSAFMMLLMCFGYVILGGAMDKKGTVFCFITGIASCLFGIILQFIHLVYQTYYGVLTYSYYESILMVPQIYGRMEDDIKAAFMVEDISTILTTIIVLIVCLRIFYYRNKIGMVFRKM